MSQETDRVGGGAAGSAGATAQDAAARDADERAGAVVDWFVNRNGAPGLDHYRAVYADLGLAWPGDDEIRRLYPVAAAA